MWRLSASAGRHIPRAEMLRLRPLSRELLRLTADAPRLRVVDEFCGVRRVPVVVGNVALPIARGRTVQTVCTGRLISGPRWERGHHRNRAIALVRLDVNNTYVIVLTGQLHAMCGNRSKLRELRELRARHTAALRTLLDRNGGAAVVAGGRTELAVPFDVLMGV